MSARYLLLLLPLVLHAQDKDSLGTRRLYYQDNSPEVVFKSTTVAKRPAPQPKPAATATKQQELEKIQQALRSASLAITSGLKPANNLGVRFTVMKVDQKTDIGVEVPPDTVFREGDCVRVRIQPNRGGFLYMFSKGSSGKWDALFPSPEWTEESSVVSAYARIDLPDPNTPAKVSCFGMDNQPGTERLLIVITDKPEDVVTLNAALSGHDGRGLYPFTASLQRRDLKIVHVGSKPAQGEDPFTTYQISPTATKADRLVLSIDLKHGAAGAK